MENRQLFIRVLADLENRLVSNDEYETLGIARLLRQLLLDNDKLVQAIISNQPLRLAGPEIPDAPKLTFEVAAYAVPAAQESYWWAILDGFDSEYDLAWRYLHGQRTHFSEFVSVEGTAEGQRVTGQIYTPYTDETHKLLPIHVKHSITLRLDSFLNRVVIVYGSDIFTVKDIIKHLAIFSGAVHFGRARDTRERALEALVHQLYIGDLPLGIYMLLPIGRVVRRAMEPLKEYVLKSPLWQRAHWRFDIVSQPSGQASISAVPSPGSGHLGGMVPLVPPPAFEGDEQVARSAARR